MDPSAEDGGGPPTELAQDPATTHPVAVPQQRAASSGTGTSGTGTSGTGTPGTGTPGASPTDIPAGQQPPRRAGPPTVSRWPPWSRASSPRSRSPWCSGRWPSSGSGRSGARGRALAITGLALAGLWTVAAAIVAAAIITRPPPPKPVTLPQVFSLRAGQCLDSGANGISGVHVLSCAQAHDAEVFATFRLAGSRYPGAAALQQRAGQGCVSRLSGYLNPQLPAASVAQSYVYPDAGAWAAGERTVVCTVHSTSGPLVGSVRAAP